MVGGENTATASVEWQRLPRNAITPPVVETLRYVEVKLEHPGLAATGRGKQFFPDAVPYTLDGERRVFYWRSALETALAREPADWALACATTHGLAGIGELPSGVPPLTSDGVGAAGDVRHAVVGGTIAGDVTTVGLSGYEPPAVRVEAVSSDAITVAVDGRSIEVDAGTRRTVELPSRCVTLAQESRETSTVPELSIRFPGRRTLHHPAPGAEYRCFPPFGLDLDGIETTLSVPTSVGELDHGRLAERLGVDLTGRPYPERVLWQAFAHAAFDPHDERPAAIGQLGSGHLVVGSRHTRFCEIPSRTWR